MRVPSGGPRRFLELYGGYFALYQLPFYTDYFDKSHSRFQWQFYHFIVVIAMRMLPWCCGVNKVTCSINFEFPVLHGKFVFTSPRAVFNFLCINSVNYLYYFISLLCYNILE